LGLFGKKGLTFEKLKISNSKITSDKFSTITLNLKNNEEKFDSITVTTKTDDLNNEYLKIDKPLLQLPSLDFPNRNTGDHIITITPFNIPLNKMTFKITVEVFANNKPKSVLRKNFNLDIVKKT
jgi:ribosomal protein L9